MQGEQNVYQFQAKDKGRGPNDHLKIKANFVFQKLYFCQPVPGTFHDGKLTFTKRVANVIQQRLAAAYKIERLRRTIRTRVKV